MTETIKLVTYNIDGLPEQLDLNDLPWILKPIAWIYKLFKGTTIVTINDNGDKNSCMTEIGEYLSKTGADVMAVQEDFNYHDTLVKPLEAEYASGKYTGGFDLKHLFSSTEWLTCFPLPRFKCDGLNMFSKKSSVELKEEEIIRWKKSYGYFTHANDKLTHKGFRHYLINANGVDLDIYVVHMDADFYDPVKCPDVTKDINARTSQLKQLVKYILKRYEDDNNYPAIIIGDTNSYDKYQWDVDNIYNNLLKPINETDGLTIKEAIPSNYSDCDKVFYINNVKAKHQLAKEECHFDLDAKRMSDHKPLIATFTVK